MDKLHRFGLVLGNQWWQTGQTLGGAFSESRPIAFIQAAIFFKWGISSEEISTWRLLVVQAGGSPLGAANSFCYLRKTSQIMHDYEMRIGHSLLWSHVFSPYYTTRGLFERLCTYKYFIETHSSSLIRNTPQCQWGWFCTVRTNSAKSAQRVSRAIVCYVLGFQQLSVFTKQR